MRINPDTSRFVNSYIESADIIRYVMIEVISKLKCSDDIYTDLLWSSHTGSLNEK